MRVHIICSFVQIYSLIAVNVNIFALLFVMCKALSGHRERRVVVRVCFFFFGGCMHAWHVSFIMYRGRTLWKLQIKIQNVALLSLQ